MTSLAILDHHIFIDKIGRIVLWTPLNSYDEDLIPITPEYDLV